MTSEIDKLKHFHVENYSDTNFTDDLNGLKIKILFAGMEDYLNIKIMFLLVDILILVYYMNMIFIKDGCLKKQYILIVLK